MDKKYYEHTLEGKPPSEWQPIEEHLRNVARMARSFAEAFGVQRLLALGIGVIRRDCGMIQ